MGRGARILQIENPVTVRRLDLAVFCDPGGLFEGRIGAKSVEGAEPIPVPPPNCIKLYPIFRDFAA